MSKFIYAIVTKKSDRFNQTYLRIPKSEGYQVMNIYFDPEAPSSYSCQFIHGSKGTPARSKWLRLYEEKKADVRYTVTMRDFE